MPQQVLNFFLLSFDGIATAIHAAAVIALSALCGYGRGVSDARVQKGDQRNLLSQLGGITLFVTFLGAYLIAAFRFGTGVLIPVKYAASSIVLMLVVGLVAYLVGAIRARA